MYLYGYVYNFHVYMHEWMCVIYILHCSRKYCHLFLITKNSNMHWNREVITMDFHTPFTRVNNYQNLYSCFMYLFLILSLSLLNYLKANRRSIILLSHSFICICFKKVSFVTLTPNRIINNLWMYSNFPNCIKKKKQQKLFCIRIQTRSTHDIWMLPLKSLLA